MTDDDRRPPGGLLGWWRRLTGRGDLPADVVLDADERVLARAELADGRALVATSHGLWLPADPDRPTRRVGWHLVSKATWRETTLILVEAREVERFDDAGRVAAPERSPTAASDADADSDADAGRDADRPAGDSSGPGPAGPDPVVPGPVSGSPSAAPAASGPVRETVVLADLRARQLVLAAPGRLPQVVQQRVTGSIRSRHHRDLPGGGAWFVQRKVAGRDGITLQVRPDPGTDPDAVRRVAAGVAATVHGRGAAGQAGTTGR